MQSGFFDIHILDVGGRDPQAFLRLRNAITYHLLIDLFIGHELYHTKILFFPAEIIPRIFFILIRLRITSKSFFREDPEQFQVLFCIRMTLGCGFPKPKNGLVIALYDPFPGKIHKSDIVLGIRITLSCKV